MFRTTFPWWLPGGALVAFGALIVIFPDLLALMVATAFLFFGFSLLAAGWVGRKARGQMGRRIVFFDGWR